MSYRYVIVTVMCDYPPMIIILLWALYTISTILIYVWYSAFYISKIHVFYCVFLHCVVLDSPFGLLDNCTGCKGI